MNSRPHRILANDNLLSPLLALELLQHTREPFLDNELRRKFQTTTKAVLKDAEDRLLSMSCREKTESIIYNPMPRGIHGESSGCPSSKPRALAELMT